MQMETKPNNLKYQKLEIPPALILNSGFLDSKFSAFQNFAL